MLTFTEYCNSKSINAIQFKRSDEILYNDLEVYFNQVHPDSFTAQKLFLINELRRRYHFLKPDEKNVSTGGKSNIKPKISKPIGFKNPGVKISGIKKSVEKTTEQEEKDSTFKSSVKPKITRSKIKPKPKTASKDSSTEKKVIGGKPIIPRKQKKD